MVRQCLISLIWNLKYGPKILGTKWKFGSEKKISKVLFLLRSNFAFMSYGFAPTRNGFKHSGNLAKTNLSISDKFVKISIKYHCSKRKIRFQINMAHWLLYQLDSGQKERVETTGCWLTQVFEWRLYLSTPKAEWVTMLK